MKSGKLLLVVKLAKNAMVYQYVPTFKTLIYSLLPIILLVDMKRRKNKAMSIFIFSSPGRNPGRAIVLTRSRRWRWRRRWRLRRREQKN